MIERNYQRAYLVRVNLVYAQEGVAVTTKKSTNRGRVPVSMLRCELWSILVEVNE